MASTTSSPRNPEALVSVGQAAAALGVHPNTIRIWAERGRLPAYRINARGDRRFRRADVERLLGAASGGEVADPSTERQAELDVLAGLAEWTAGGADLADFCRLSLEALHTRLGYSRLAIYLRDEDGTLSLAAHVASDVPPPATLAPASIPSDVVGLGRPRALPLRVGRQLIGHLLVGGEPSMRSGVDAASFTTAFGAALAAAIHHRRLVTRVKTQLHRASALRGASRELTEQLDLNAVLADSVERGRHLFGADKAGLWLFDASAERPFRLASQTGIGAEHLELVSQLGMESDSIGVRAIREQRVQVRRDADRKQGAGLPPEAYARDSIRTACIVPLLTAGEAVGVLGLYHSTDRPWSHEELILVQSFADQAAVAIVNAQLYQSSAEQASRLRSIQYLSARLNHLTDVTAIAEAIVTEAAALADYHDIRVYTVDWTKRMCEPIAFQGNIAGAPGNFAERLRVRVGEGLTGWVAEHGEALLINDALDDPRAKTIEGTDEVPESMLLVPMTFEEQVLGIIVLSKLGTHQFSADDLQTMTIFAGYAAQAVANAAAYERMHAQSAELERRLDSQRRLLQINERLQSSLDQGAVLETIADGLQAVVAYDNLSIYRIERARSALMPVLAREAYQEEVMRHVVPFGRGLMGWAVVNAEPVLVNDALADPRSVQIPGTPEEPEAIIIVPLVAEGEVIGAMNVGRIGGEEVYFSLEDFELVKLFAGQAAIALQNAVAHEAERRRADTDALTGLRNHGAFQRSLAQLLDAAHGQTAQPAAELALVMMDLDSFKVYNDRLGHPAGDALLHAAATAIYAAARADDLVYRYGGDEFALILTGAGRNEAVGVAERIRQAVARLTAEGDAPRVTITTGIALHPTDASDKDGLIAAADTALYSGKQAGGDRIVVATDVPGEVRELRATLDALARAALQTASPGGKDLQTMAAASLLASGHEQAEAAGARRALLQVARRLATADAERRTRGERVGRLASQVAQAAGIEPELVDSVELAARLAALGESGDDGVSTRELRGPFRLVRQVADRRSFSESAVARDPLALAGQVLAAVEAYDALTTGAGPQSRTRSTALAALRSADPGYLPRVLDALATVVGGRRDRGRRRRATDLTDEVAGAA